jgi:hypothetical protein
MHRMYGRPYTSASACHSESLKRVPPFSLFAHDIVQVGLCLAHSKTAAVLVTRWLADIIQPSHLIGGPVLDPRLTLDEDPLHDQACMIKSGSSGTAHADCDEPLTFCTGRYIPDISSQCSTA